MTSSLRVVSGSNLRPKIVLRSRLPLVWLLLLLIAALLLPSRIWNTLLIGLGGLIVVAYIWVRLLARGLHANRRLRFGWVAVGDRLSEQFEIQNRSGVPAIWVEVVDESTVPGYQAAVVRSVPINATDSWRESAICLRRGQFSLGPWFLRSSDPFGIFFVTIPYPQSDDIIIHPPVHVQVPIPLPTGQSAGSIRGRVRNWQATISAAGIRDYAPHDPLHWIHWPTTARRNQLSTRLFDLDAAGDVWLLLDMQSAVQLGQDADGTEEHAILLAAALAAQALRRNRAAGIAAYGQEPQIVPPVSGHGQLWKVLRALALAKADGQSDLSQALRDVGRIARRGSTAIVITPSGQTDWLPELLHLSQRGVRCSTLLLNRSSFTGDAGLPEGGNLGLQDAIQRLGFRCHIISQGDVGIPSEEYERRGFWEFKVTGTGKVVTTRSPLRG
ncbi:MAG: DUF58 domain-containing protein [Candidatus Promineifilaceae bacterium]